MTTDLPRPSTGRIVLRLAAWATLGAVAVVFAAISGQDLPVTVLVLCFICWCGGIAFLLLVQSLRQLSATAHLGDRRKR